jgi:F-type H+-transporting ATPase subunit b
LDALGINGGFFIAQIVNFIIVAALLSLAWKPLMRMLDERSRRIAEGLEKERQAQEQLERAQADYDAKMAEAEAEARKKIVEATARAEESTKAIREEAETEAQRIRERAVEDAQAERNRLLSDMRGQVAALAIAAANKLVGEAMDEQRQRALVTDFFAKVPADVKATGAETVEVTSALPLTDEEKQQAQEAIGAKEVNFKVDPNILGGLIVRAGDQVVDGSFQGQLRQLAQRMQ